MADTPTPAPPLTVAERLTVLVERLVGATHTITRAATAGEPARGHANYEFATLANGDRVLRIRHDETGEVFVGRGKTNADAVADLEAKFPAVV